MQNITIIHIFIILLILKLCSVYVNNNYLFLLFGFIAIIIYLITNKQINIDISLFKLDEDKQFEHKKILLLNYVTEFYNNFNLDSKQLLIDEINLFNENSSIIFYNNVKNCKLYMDILHEQRTDIINNASSLIITIPNYENYKFFETFIKNVHDTLDDIFEFIHTKCPSYHVKKFIYFDKKKYLNSFNYV